MILFTYGPFGWCEKIRILQMRTEWLCEQLEALNVKYFREPFMNIITIEAQNINQELVKKFDLVPQKHDGNNQWYKIVIMDHVEIDHLMTFITDLKTTIQKNIETIEV